MTTPPEAIADAIRLNDKYGTTLLKLADHILDHLHEAGYAVVNRESLMAARLDWYAKQGRGEL